MPIKPIDLQMLFMQLDQLGKGQNAAKEGTTVQQAVQGAVAQKRSLEEAKSVRKPETPGDGAERVRTDQQRRKEEGNEEDLERDQTAGGEEKAESEIIKDPELGSHVDVSG